LNGTRPQMQPTTGSMARTAIPACISRDTGRWIGTVSPSTARSDEGPHDRVARISQDRRVTIAPRKPAAADERKLTH